MIPTQPGQELARAVAIVRSTGRRVAVWRGTVAGIPVAGIALLAIWVPDVWLSRPGSWLPLVLSGTALALVGVAGLATGTAIRAGRLRRSVVEIETTGGLACGELLGAIEFGHRPADPGGLTGLHRARVASVLQGRSARDLLPLSHARLSAARRVGLSGLGAALGLLMAGLWGFPGRVPQAMETLTRPWAVTFPAPPPPLRLEPPGGEVLRGSGFELVISAVGRSHVTLGQSRSGTVSRRNYLTVSAGIATGRIDPVDETIRFWAEDERGSVTDTFVVTPLDPLTITDMRIELTFPSYLRRSPEVVTGPITSLQVPSGATLDLQARTNHPVESLGLIRERVEGVDTVVFAVANDLATGALAAHDSALLSWWIVPSESVPGMRVPPPIVLSIEEDRPASVVLVYPGEDRLLGMDRALRLVVEARDDHGLDAVGLTWWRESTGGRTDPPVHERLADGGGARRLVLRPIMDLEDAGLLPGDQIVYFATARDARPGVPPSVSDTFRARLSGLQELREEVARRSETLVEDARSLVERVGNISDDAHDAERRSAERLQDPRGGEPAAEHTDFGATQEARVLLGEAGEVEAEVARLQENLREARTALDSSPFADPELQRRLGELEDLYQEILESGLRERIQALEESLRGLDRDDLHDALADFTRHSADLEERLEQALGVMERVAIEQSLERVREAAEDLADRQRRISERDPAEQDWTDQQERLAAESEALAQRVDELAERIEGQQAPDAAERSRQAAEGARAAVSRMRSATREPGEAETVETDRRGEQARAAASDLSRAERDLAVAEELLAVDWRSEAVQAVGRATAEALELARQQERIVQRLQSGERPEDLSARQSAIREGLDNLSQSLAKAGRKTALLDRRAGPAAAQAGDQMEAVGQSLSGGAARRSEAVQQGRSAVESLGDLAGSLMASHRMLEEASSATGMEEAVERLAGMGRIQAGLNSESDELFGLLRGGWPIEDRLRSLSGRQGDLSRDLRDLENDPAAQKLGVRPGELAAEADEIARRLAAGTLDGATLARQEKLFRRLLDAGRSLEKDERDANRREATSAKARVTLLPDEDSRIVPGSRYPYPDERHMKGLTWSQRRLVYEYFDRLNAQVSVSRP